MGAEQPLGEDYIIGTPKPSVSGRDVAQDFYISEAPTFPDEKTIGRSGIITPLPSEEQTALETPAFIPHRSLNDIPLREKLKGPTADIINQKRENLS